MSGSLDFAVKVLEMLPGLISSGVNVVQTINTYREKLVDMSTSGRAPTPAEWSELNQRIADLRAQLHSGGSGV